jgi:hypothetical protein
MTGRCFSEILAILNIINLYIAPFYILATPAGTEYRIWRIRKNKYF